MSLLLSLLSGALAVPAAVFFAECAASLRKEPESSGASASTSPAWILVPAHNEVLGIEATLASIQGAMRSGDRLIVIADNCTDETADLSRAAGAEVLVRNDREKRGKGFAIHHAVAQLESERLALLTTASSSAVEQPLPVCVVLDADCRITPSSVAALVAEVESSACPAQADYLMSSGVARPSVGTKISEFAILVKNRLRPRGGKSFGVPCPLTGSGMAFPWKALVQTRSMEGNVVEDLALGVDFCSRDLPARYCPQARVHSELPSSKAGVKSQRNRWESGHLATLFGTAPRLFVSGLASRRWPIIAQALDLAVPPLSLLVMAQVGLTSGLLVYGMLSGAFLPAVVSSAGLSLVALGVAIAWSSEGRHVISIRDLMLVPLYAAGKLPRFFSFLFRGPEKKWVRTARGTE